MSWRWECGARASFHTLAKSAADFLSGLFFYEPKTGTTMMRPLRRTRVHSVIQHSVAVSHFVEVTQALKRQLTLGAGWL